MPFQLSEEHLHSLATSTSFERGLEYYRAGAIFSAYRLGNALSGSCTGQTAPVYQVSAELDEGGVRSASCSCPYEFEGYCKHIVALLLAYVHTPQKFIQRKSVPELLAGLERDALVEWIARMVEHSPDLYPWLETRLTPQPHEKRSPQVSEPTCCKQIKSILRSGRSYNEWENRGSVANDLDSLRAAAVQFLETGAPEDALVIFQTLLTEMADEYEDLYDDEGELLDFACSLGLPMAEAVLSAELTATELQSLRKRLDKAFDILSDYSVDGLDVVLDAIDQGWKLDPNTQKGNSELNDARLNVLKRQERIDDYLTLCRQAGKYRRYALQLIELGRIAEASQAALSHLTLAADALEVAKILRDAGRLKEAIALGERGLTLPDDKYNLGIWLAPLEEVQGRPEIALQAYQAAFNASPTLELYKHLKRLSAGWGELKPKLIAAIQAARSSDVLASVYLLEQEWDAAIAIAEQDKWSYGLLEKVADNVIPHRPDWVIRISQAQAEELIAKTKSKLYPAAAGWLVRMKKACLSSGRTAQWQSYLSTLKVTYSRRPALQAQLKEL